MLGQFVKANTATNHHRCITFFDVAKTRKICNVDQVLCIGLHPSLNHHVGTTSQCGNVGFCQHLQCFIKRGGAANTDVIQTQNLLLHRRGDQQLALAHRLFQVVAQEHLFQRERQFVKGGT